MKHKWTGGKIGTDYGTGVEYVRYCEICGFVDPGEDEIPDCPGIQECEAAPAPPASPKP